MPTPRYKILIVEVDGTELEFQEELSLDSDKVYFTSPGYTSDNAQSAIVETIQKSGSARTPYGFYYDSNANSGRWLEVSKGVSSQTSPHVSPQVGTLKSISISVKDATTTTLTVYKNGASVHTLNLAAAQTNYISGLNTAIVAGDKLSAQITGGSCQEPNVQVNIQVSAV